MNTKQEKNITQLNSNPHPSLDTILLTPEQFAEGMPFTLGTLNNSRLKGRLMGYTAPRHYCFGRLIRYPASEREHWLSNFKLFTSTGESHAEKVKETSH